MSPIDLHKKEVNRSFKMTVCVFGYTWWDTCYAVHKYNRVYRSNRAVFFSSTHLCTLTWSLIGTRVLTQNVLASIFRAISFACTRGAKHESKYTHCVCMYYYMQFSFKFKSSCTVPYMYM